MKLAGTRGVRIVDFGPERSWFRPGSEAAVLLALESPGGMVDARLEVLDDGRVVDSVEGRLRLAAGRQVRRFRIRVPDVGRHGYGLRLLLEGPGGRVEVHSAFEALEGWWESPRHAALTDFQPGADASGTAQSLRRWHVNVAQFYDWMYRHYQYLPPRGEPVFTDTLGRVVSHRVVRELVRQCRRRAIASLAYGSVYGAEREYIERHPEQLLRAADGRPLSLGETFFITDLRANSRWRGRLMSEYLRACRRFGFDGIHMDQYGEPHEGIAADGSLVRLDELYAGLVDETAQRLARLSPPRRVLFNCVGGWPLEAVADARTAATYIEIWPPDTTYGAIVRQVERARRHSPAKQVVIAAYPSVVAPGGAEGGPSVEAVEALLLLTSVVLAAGAYHHVLAEGDRVLVGGYYPEAVSLPARAAEALRLAWQFSARYVHVLSDAGSESVPIEGLTLQADGRTVPVAVEPRAGSVWVRAVRTAQDSLVVQLVDLLDQRSDEWDAGRQPAARRTGWRFSWAGQDRTWLFASPWSNYGVPESVATGAEHSIPAFERWALLVGSGR